MLVRIIAATPAAAPSANKAAPPMDDRRGSALRERAPVTSATIPEVDG